MTESLGATNLQNSVPQPSPSADAGTTWATRLTGLGLTLARALWLLGALLTVGTFVVVLPIAYQQMLNFSPSFLPQGWTPELVRAAQTELGLARGFFAGYSTTLAVVFALEYWIVAVVIFWRKSDDWMALFVSLTFVLFGMTNLLPSGRTEVEATLDFLGTLLTVIAYGLVLVFLFLFPDGRFVPRWTPAVVAVWSGIVVVWGFFPDSPLSPSNLPSWFFMALTLGVWGVGLFAQIYRYRRLASAMQREQTKWVVYGVVVGVSGVLLFDVVLPTLFPSLAQPDAEGLFYLLLNLAARTLFSLLIPVAIAVSILRHRLYDIDLLINRTLVYVPLTASLAGLFAVSIDFSKKFFLTVSGQESDWDAVFTSLVVVAAFDPLRRGLQNFVDKRFKEAPDVVKKLDAFGDRIRARIYAVDAGQLTRRLLEETVAAFEAQSGAVYRGADENANPLHRVGEWKGDAALSVPLESDGKRWGSLALGARRRGAEYTTRERAALQKTAALVAQALVEDG